MGTELLQAVFTVALVAFFIWVVFGPKLKSEVIADKAAGRGEPPVTRETLEKLASTLAKDTLGKFNCYSTLTPKQCKKLYARFHREYRRELGLA